MLRPAGGKRAILAARAPSLCCGTDPMETIMRHLMRVAAASALLGMAACSSSFGTASNPPPAKVVVMPAPAAAVCANGTAPPCQ